MATRHSKNAKKECNDDFIIECHLLDSKKVFTHKKMIEKISELEEECPVLDHIDAPSTSAEYWRGTVPTTVIHSIQSLPPDKPTSSGPGHNSLAQDVFLSHSGKQKNFVRQLHRDLTNQGIFCFFDEDRESLPVGEDFPSLIFEAAKTCKVALLLLSVDFLVSKWPMLELSALMEAKYKTRTNPNLKILPLFFKISPDALKSIAADTEKWKQLENSDEKRAEWQKALNRVRPLNGLKFVEGGDEVKFRDEIVKEIWRILQTPTPRYFVPCMQGQARMCQEVADFISTVHPDRKGVCIAGLNGIAGQGKTTLCKAFCSFKLGEFEGKVCHLEFSRGDSFERIKLALRYLTHCRQLFLETVKDHDEAQVELYRRVKGHRVLLVLDNITEESIDEVRYFVAAELGENSCILLSARSEDILVKHFKIDKQSCMRMPELKEEEAIAILLERTCVEESTLTAEERVFAVKCAHRCSFKEVGPRKYRTFHPLALKAFGGHLSSKYGSDLSAWVDKTEGLVDRSGYGLDDLLALLGKAFDNMCREYRIIFMLLTLYMPPKMSPHKVTQWLAMIINEEISFIEKAVEVLYKDAFIEDSGQEIHIHDLYVEFAQSRANEMRRWLWWKRKQPSPGRLISKEDAGFELARFERCMHQTVSQIALHDFRNLLVLQLVGVQNVSKLYLGGMGSLRSITIHSCKDLIALEGMRKLQRLAWLQISEVSSMFVHPNLNSLKGLQYLEIKFARNLLMDQKADLTGCVSLREINLCFRSLKDFPRLEGLRDLEKVEFSVYDIVDGPFDCTDCVELQSTVIDSRSFWAVLVFLSDYKKISKTLLWDRDAVIKACPDIDVPSALEACSDRDVQINSCASLNVFSALKSLESCDGLKDLQLWNLKNVKKLPNLRLQSKLTVLKLGKCGIREPPDLKSCVLLEDVCFFTLENLESFPNFSPLRKLKKLRLYNCRRVEYPPDISGCNELQVFHLVYNDSMEGLPNMGELPQLEEIKLSWQSEDSSEFRVDHESLVKSFREKTFSNLGDVSAPEALKEWEWLKGKRVMGKRYVRARKMYYLITAPYATSHEGSQLLGKVTVVEWSTFRPTARWFIHALTVFICCISFFIDIKFVAVVRITFALSLDVICLVTICWYILRRLRNNKQKRRDTWVFE